MKLDIDALSLKGLQLRSASSLQVDKSPHCAKLLGKEFDKRKVALREPIRDVWTYVIPVRLAADVAPTVTVVVMAEGVKQVRER